MADPTLVSCSAGAWTKVATNVSACTVHTRKHGGGIRAYLHTYRATGEAAPTDLSEAVHISSQTKQLLVQDLSGVDIYIYCVGDAGQTGQVRVDS